jgi:hypothetical protein
LEGGSGRRAKGCREAALADAGGAAATIPEMFFNLQWGAQENELTDSGLTGKRRPDEKLGQLECYVFVEEQPYLTRTLWIAKDDFLIHQVRTVRRAEGMQPLMIGSGIDRELIVRMQGGGMLASTSTETHTNIVVNKRFSRADFLPSFPSYSNLDDE